LHANKFSILRDIIEIISKFRLQSSPLTMSIPKFLVADNTDQPDSIFIIHTQFPHFAWDVNHDTVEWFDELEGEEEELINEVADLMETAEAFYEREMKRHETEMGED